MSQKIYVGNLPYSASDADLQQNFSAFGDVVSATVMNDRDTGRSQHRTTTQGSSRHNRVFPEKHGLFRVAP